MAKRVAFAPSPKGEDVGSIPQWKLSVRRFMRNKLSVTGAVVLIVFYLTAILADFVSPYPFDALDSRYPVVPPTHIRFSLTKGLYYHPTVATLDKESFKFVLAEDTAHPVRIRFFVEGYEYKLFGLIPSRVHLFGTERPEGLNETPKVLLMGTDRQGRDMFSRLVVGGRISLSIGLVSIALSTVLGSVLGTASGYFGGWIDNLMQRTIELIQTFPTIPLWAALTAALPRDLPIVQRYILISVILSLIGWTGLARQVRGKVMAFRSADFTAAAKAAGASHLRIIIKHLVPNSISHIIVVAVLAVPGTILGETALSFLGLGILPPAVSWGVLLRSAQQLTVMLQFPWLTLPVVAVILTVLCFSFMGDGLRDAVDPYN